MSPLNKSFVTILIVSVFIIYGMTRTVDMLSSNDISSPAVSGNHGIPETSPMDGMKPAENPFHYLELADVLKSSVNNRGEVNYGHLKANRKRLDEFIIRIAKVEAKKFRKWPEIERLVFWINTYNALTLRLIIDNYPIQPRGGLKALTFPKNSIRQIPGVWEEPKYRVMSQLLSLDEIENKIMRVRFNDARIHMTIVCASVGCPSLRAEPFTAGRLDKQIHEQATHFFKDSTKFRVHHAMKRISISPIFKWFSEDFTRYMDKRAPGTRPIGREESIIWFASLYSNDVQFPQHATYKVNFLDYDWSLNEQR